MTGNEDIKIGDRLRCISNEGLMSMGEHRTIQGLTETSININSCSTSWQNRKDFRWHCYEHIPATV